VSRYVPVRSWENGFGLPPIPCGAIFHLDEAFLCYRRAFQTAINTRNTTHQLGAASYSGELCLGRPKCLVRLFDELRIRTDFAETEFILTYMSARDWLNAGNGRVGLITFDLDFLRLRRRLTALHAGFAAHHHDCPETLSLGRCEP
jgi:hypothetical protein